ncbi:unnamed protein product, partial [Musa acuminata subsp. malaccensis]
LVHIPGTPGDGAAASAVRIRPLLPLAVVVGLPSPVARHPVLAERAVAYEPRPGAREAAPGGLRLHRHLLLLVDAVSDPSVADWRRPKPAISTRERSDAPFVDAVGGFSGRGRLGQEKCCQEDGYEGKSESH